MTTATLPNIAELAIQAGIPSEEFHKQVVRFACHVFVNMAKNDGPSGTVEHKEDGTRYAVHVTVEKLDEKLDS